MKIYHYAKYNESGDRNMYSSFYSRAYWDITFLWWPRQCNLSGKWLWLCYADRGEAMYTGPGEPIFERRYHSRDEHLLWLLTRNFQ